MPVPRLVNKIGISRYMELPTNDLGALSPAEVRIPLRQHIGAPAQAVVKAGDRVKCGDVIGEIPEQSRRPYPRQHGRRGQERRRAVVIGK